MIAQILKSAVKNPRKNFQGFPRQIIKNLQKALWDALSTTLHRFLQTEWHNTFFIFYKVFEQNTKKVIPKNFADFIIAVTGNCIEEELGGVGTCPVLRI